MEYNIYRIALGLRLFEVCEETEQMAKIVCAHCNRKSIKEVHSIVKIGETDSPYIKEITIK